MVNAKLVTVEKEVKKIEKIEEVQLTLSVEEARFVRDVFGILGDGDHLDKCGVRDKIYRALYGVLGYGRSPFQTLFLKKV